MITWNYTGRLLARGRARRLGGLDAREWGDGPIVLVLASRDALSSLVDPIVWSGRRVVAIELPASGAVEGATRELGPIDAVIAHGPGVGAATAAMRSGALAAERSLVIAEEEARLRGSLNVAHRVVSFLDAKPSLERFLFDRESRLAA